MYNLQSLPSQKLLSQVTGPELYIPTQPRPTYISAVHATLLLQGLTSTGTASRGCKPNAWA